MQERRLIRNPGDADRLTAQIGGRCDVLGAERHDRRERSLDERRDRDERSPRLPGEQELGLVGDRHLDLSCLEQRSGADGSPAAYWMLTLRAARWKSPSACAS